MIIGIIFVVIVYLVMGIILAAGMFDNVDMLYNKNPLLGIPVVIFWPVPFLMLIIYCLYHLVVAYVESVIEWYRKNGGKR